MKKIIVTALAVFAFGFSNAQKKIEAKINPLGALFGRPDISGEYIVSDNFGVELSLGIAFGDASNASVSVGDASTGTAKQSGFGVKATAK